jgi:hypothetical protein
MYPFYSVYTNGRVTSPDMLKVCLDCDTLTLREEYFHPKYQYQTIDETIFKEIKMLRPEQKISLKHRKLLEPMPEFDGTLKEFGKQLTQRIKNFFYKVWNPNIPHMVFHSSGYDSRIISGVLTEIREEQGSEWLGDIHFRCHQPEGPGFIKIMEREGWKPEQYSVFNAPELDHYDIGKSENVMNGWVSHVVGMNFWRDILSEDRERDISVVCGLGGGELFSYPAVNMGIPNRMKYANNKNLDTWLNYFPERGVFTSYWYCKFKELLMPYMSYDYMELSLTSKPKWCKLVNRPLDKVRHSMISNFNIDLLSDIPWYRHAYLFGLSEGRKNHMIESWIHSELVKDYPKLRKIDPTTKDRHIRKLYGFMTFYEKLKSSRC